MQRNKKPHRMVGLCLWTLLRALGSAVSGVFVEVVNLAGVLVTAGATDLLVEAAYVEVLVFHIDVVVDTRAVSVGAEESGFTIPLVHFTIHCVVRVETVVSDLVLLIVDLNVLVSIVDGGVQGDTLRSVGTHGDFGSVTENDCPLLLLPILQVLTVQIFVGVSPMLQCILSGRVFHRNGVLVHRHLIATTGGVGDRLTLFLLLETTLRTVLRSAASAGRALVSEVEIHVGIGTSTPVRLGIWCPEVRRALVAAVLWSSEVVSVRRWVRSASAMLGVVLVAALTAVVAAKHVSEQPTDGGAQKSGYRVETATEHGADNTTCDGAPQAGTTRAEKSVAAVLESATPTTTSVVLVTSA